MSYCEHIAFILTNILHWSSGDVKDDEAKSVIQEVLQHSSKHSVVQTWIKMGVPRGVD